MTGGYLCSLHNGDLITVQWAGDLRIVVVVITADGVALRDLTEDEGTLLDEAAAQALEDPR